MQEFIDRIRAAIASHSGLAPEDLKLESPRDASLGDLAFPCFPLAKALKQAPPKIAAELAPKLAGDLEGVEVSQAGPYLNFRIERAALAASVLSAIDAAGDQYGGSTEGAGKTVVLDFSSPNIAKPFHVGHLRSTILGAAVQRLHQALGYETVGINHIGDWGSQFGKLVAAIQRWGDEVDLEGDPIAALLELYVRFHREEKDDPTLAEEGRAAFRELESGEDGEVRKIWRRLTELSLREFDRAYDRLGVTFDHVRGEAFYEPFLDPTVERIVAAGVTEESEGALIVRLDDEEKGVPPCLLRKSDGTTLYATRDLAALFHRWDEFAFDRCLYVVGSDQRLHFRQLKAVLKRMDAAYEPRVEHVDFGMLRLPEGKLSTRQGRVVILEDLLNEAISVARGIIAEKNPDLANADEVAEEVGIGAVIFHDLKRERVKDVVFDWEEVLSFEGETGPYVQYTHARLGSILRKGAAEGATPAATDAASLAPLEDAAELLLLLGRFPTVVRNAAAEAEPSLVTRYSLELSRAVNSWYVNHRVLGEAPEVTAARLRLVSAARTVLARALFLIGVRAPDAM